ncbi:MAG TPA: hypothetical protein VKE24_04435 [Candidatus Acidoferrales bacterium]|nr:hypothetical protein [Candidatus Acidoferrales bacterium]
MPSRPTAMTLLAGALTLMASGCHKRAVTAQPPADAVSAPQPAAPPEKKPDSSPQQNASTPALVVPPAKPAPASPAPAPPKPAPPQISPQLTPEEQAVAERVTNANISAAESNLERAYGMQLNTAQHDLVEKIRGFLGQAREAIRASDWVRARNLARKAQVLSVELINSL